MGSLFQRPDQMASNRLLIAFLLAAVAITCDALPTESLHQQDSFPVSQLGLDINWQQDAVYILPRDLVEGGQREKRSPQFFNGRGYYNGYNRPNYYPRGRGFGGYRYRDGRLIRTAVVAGGAALAGGLLGYGLAGGFRG